MSKEYIDNKNRRYRLIKNSDDEVFLIKKIKENMAEFTQFEIMNLQFEEIKPLNGWESQELEGEYYRLDAVYKISKDTDVKSEFDNKLYENLNYFSTKEKAEEVAREQNLYRMMKKFYDENDGQVDINDGDNKKYYILYNISTKNMYINHVWNIIEIHTIYFSKEEIAERCLKDIVAPFFEKHPK